MNIVSVKENSNTFGRVSYKITMSDGTVIHSVPKSNSNLEYNLIKEWIANGGVVEPFETPSEIALREKNEANEAIKRELEELDKLSIRDIREWIALQPNAPQMLKEREAQAVDARSRLQP